MWNATSEIHNSNWIPHDNFNSVQKVFDKFSDNFWYSKNKPLIEGNSYNLIKNTYEKFLANIKLTGEKVTPFRSVTKQELLSFPSPDTPTLQ